MSRIIVVVVVETATKPSRFAHFWQSAQSLAPATQNHISTVKSGPCRAGGALYILTWKCASRHNGVHFFDIWTSKSGPNPSVFYTFDLEMCFAPQRCALFQHLIFQKWSDVGAFCTFWLGNVLRATTACTFSTSELQKWSEPDSFLFFWLGNVLRATAVWLFQHLIFQKWSEPVSFLHFWLRNVLRATAVCTFSASHLPKVVRCWCVLYVLTWKCASRDNGTSKSGPNPSVFYTFDLEMCFAPQRRALFRHLNFQKWSEPVSFLHFWLGNALRATKTCNYSSLIWPAGSAPAALASLLCDPPEPQIIGKTEWIATFLPFRAPASSVFSLFLFSALLTSWLLLSDSSHLCFSICPYCRKFDF